MASAASLLDGLDDQQRAAASSVEGPVRIVACAGAGKTRTITRRIAYGCAAGAMDPLRVLAVTFSVKAAREMQERIESLQVPGPRVSTFHAAALRQCRQAWPRLCKGDFPRLLDTDRDDVVGAAMLRVTGAQADPRALADVAQEIDWCKVSLVTPEAYARVCASSHREPPAMLDIAQFTHVYEEYEREKTVRVAIDFNDILLLASHICDAGDDVARDLVRRIGWLTVDEYQDVSPLQHRLMRAWLGDNRNVCVVGDPAQTIYSFAGATSYYLAGFDREFAPLAADIALRTDYRSVPPIVAQANRVLAKSPERHGYLRLQAARPGTARVASTIYGTDAEEAEGVALRIGRLMRQGARPGECAILTRLGSQQAAFVRALRAHGIPYQVRREDVRQAVGVPREASAVGSLVELQAGRVTVCTIHASKGLEFPHVFLVGLSDGLLPYQGAPDAQRLEEERRLLYVGVTRAEDTLHLSYAVKQDAQSGGRRTLSRFLS